MAAHLMEQVMLICAGILQTWGPWGGWGWRAAFPLPVNLVVRD